MVKKKYSFKEIDDFKFIDEIASDDFKEADKFSYILGKNENNEMIYGNFKEHCNLGVFGRNETVVNSLLNSMILHFHVLIITIKVRQKMRSRNLLRW